MPYYMVFGSKKRPVMGGGKYLDWVSGGPIGVYMTEKPDQACVAAAKDSNDMGTFFAIEGYIWGMEMVEAPTAVGDHRNPNQRLERLLEESAKLNEARLQLEQARDRRELNGGDDS